MKAPKITFFMLVTNRDALIADYAVKSYKMVATLPSMTYCVSSASWEGAMLSRRRLLWFGGGWAAGLSLPRVPARPQNGVTATVDVITSRCPQFDIPDPIPPQHGIPYDVAQTRCLWQYD